MSVLKSMKIKMLAECRMKSDKLMVPLSYNVTTKVLIREQRAGKRQIEYWNLGNANHEVCT